MNSLIIKAISLVGNHIVAMKKDPAKIGENFMPLSTTAGLVGGAAVAATCGAAETYDLHAGIGGWETNQQIAAHLALYTIQGVIAAYSAYLVGKPRGVSID